MVTCQQLEVQISELRKFFTTNHDELKQLLNDNKTELLESFSNRLADVENQLTLNDERMTKLERTVNENNDVVKELESKIATLEEENSQLKSMALPKKIKDLEEKVEERTNRQLRETLVFKNVEETNTNESWAETKDLLAHLISDNVDGITYEHAKSQIKRAHRERSRKTDDGKRKGTRRIFAAFHSWDMSEQIKETFRQKCINNRDYNIMAEQKYGPLTTWRRQKALEKRKRLKEEGIISSGFIDFPAKLMINYPGELNDQGKKIYRVYENFSDVDVIFTPRRNLYITG